MADDPTAAARPGEQAPPAAAFDPPSAPATASREETLPSLVRQALRDTIAQPNPTETSGAPGLTPLDPERYQILDTFPGGGMGRVFKAYDRRLQRTVAIKEILHPDGDPHKVQRFLHEALVTARLEHPAIVPIHDVGCWDPGAPCYVMKLVSGQSLADLIQQTPHLTGRLGLLPHVITAAEAMAYAHTQGVVHRDLKPQNILVGAFGETVVIDWGLAKQIQHVDPRMTPPDGQTAQPPAEQLTLADEILGTPAYMPPEQARGEVERPVAADVYALGAIAYAVLSGSAPYIGDGARQVLEQVRAGPPPSLQDKAPGLAPELLAIVDKAMARQPEMRYPTARELAADLRSWQAGQLVSAYAYAPRELMRRWVARHKVALSVGGIALLLLAVLGGYLVRRLWSEQQRTTLALTQAVAARSAAEARSNLLALAQARITLDPHPLAALGWLKQLTVHAGGWEEARLIAEAALARGIPDKVYMHGERLTDLVLWSDAERLASAGEDGIVRIWNRGGRCEQVLSGHRGAVRRVAVSRDGRLLISGGADGQVVLWNLSDHTHRTLIERPSEVTQVAFAPNAGAAQSLLAAAFRDGSVVLIRLQADNVPDIHPPALTLPLASHRGLVSALGFSPTGRFLASAGQDHAVWLTELSRPGASRRLRGHHDRVEALAFAPDDTQLATASFDGMVRLWALPGGHALPGLRLSGSAVPASDVAFAPDGRQLAVALVDGTIELWERTPASRPLRLHGHIGVITRLAYAPDGQLLASAGEDRSVRLWERATGKPLAVWRGHRLAVHSLAFTPDGRQLFSASEDGTAQAWSLAMLAQTLVHPAGYGFVVGFSGDSQRLYYGLEKHGIGIASVSGPAERLLASPGPLQTVALSGDTAVSLTQTPEVRGWQLAAGTSTILPLPPGLPGAAPATATPGLGYWLNPRQRLALSADRRWVAAALGSSEPLLWQLPSGRLQRLRGSPLRAGSVLFTPDGRLLVAAGQGSSIDLWDSQTGTRVGQLQGHSREFLALAISPDGQRLAAAGSDGLIERWTLATRTPLPAWSGHRGLVLALAYTPGGARLASAGSDHTVWLWDERSAAKHLLTGHRGAVRALAFSPDGATLASGSEDHTVWLWDVATGRGTLLKEHPGMVWSLAWSPDGRWIAADTGQGSFWRWPMTVPSTPAALHRWLAAHAPALP